MSRPSPCHPILHSVMQSAAYFNVDYLQPGPKSRDLVIICIIHLCRDHPNPGPMSGRRITGGGSYVTVCLVTLTTIPLARISPFPLVPSNAGIICSSSASASCLLVRQFPRGTSASPHMSQHARIGDPTAARGAFLSNHLLWNITSTSLSRFSYPSYGKLPLNIQAKEMGCFALIYQIRSCS